MWCQQIKKVSLRPLVESEYTSDIQGSKSFANHFKGKTCFWESSKLDVFFNMSKKNLKAWVDGEASLWGPGGRIKGLSGAEGDLTCTYRKCKSGPWRWGGKSVRLWRCENKLIKSPFVIYAVLPSFELKGLVSTYLLSFAGLYIQWILFIHIRAQRRCKIILW